MESKNVAFFNKLSFFTLLGTFFLSLFFFIPYVPVTLDASKGFLISIGMTLAFFFWLISRLGDGKFMIPKDRIILYGALIPLVFLISSFFSSSKYISFFGSGFEIGTFGSMLILFILFFLSSIFFQSERRMWYFYRAFFVGAAVLAIFELINVFVGFNRFLPRLFQGISSGNMVGSWNDFALLFGLVVILAVFTIEFIKSSKALKVLYYFLIASGLFFLIMINITFVWIMVGIFSTIIFIYSISIHNLHKRGGDSIEADRKFPFIALVVLFICLIFVIGSNSIGSLISEHIRVVNPDVRLSLVATKDLAVKSIKHNPIFGTGPNTFVIDWAMWRPKGVAQTIFWNLDFTSGYSALATFAVTVGLAGLIVFLLFIFTFAKRGLQTLRTMSNNTLSNYFSIATFITSVYSWIALILYMPNVVMFMVAFASTGILIGILVYKRFIPVRTYSFLSDPRNSFFSILVLMVLMIITLSTSYVYAEKFASIIYFSKGSTSTGTIDSLAQSEKMLSNALLLDQNDVYYRTLSQIYIAEVGALLNDKTISQDTLKSAVQDRVTLAENSANAAVNQNPNQYQNYVNLGDIYSALVPLSVPNSYESAVAAYNKAQALAPNNPSIILSRASVEFAHKDDDAAKSYINQALALKPDYTDALFLYAQIDQSEGNITDAIAQAEKASQVAPTDATVFFRLGLLKYSNSDYQGAISAFTQAVLLDPSYLNAHYMLGEADAKAGKTDDAMAQFKLLLSVLPNNQDIKDAISSLAAGNLPAPAPASTTKVPPVTPSTTTPLPSH